MPVPSSITSARHGDMDLVVVSGSWPDDISGEVVVSTPVIQPDVPYALFGFGGLCRLSLRPGTHGAPADGFAWRFAEIDSPSQRLHRAAPETFRAGPTGYSSPFGMPNQANTAPLPWGDRLFATWDVGRPMEVDPLTLGFLGEVGHRDSWGEPALEMGGVLPFLFSSAHPVIDPDRDCLWTVKLGLDLATGGQTVNVVQWSGEGTEVKVWPVDGGLVLGGSHTISQSADFLVLADSGNFKVDAGEMAGGPRSATIEDDAAVYLLRKDAIEATPVGRPLVPERFRVAPTTGHFYAQWDDTDGVRVLFEHMDLMDLGYKLEAGDRDANGEPVDPALVGFYNTAMAPNSCSEVRFVPGTGVTKTEAVLRDDWTWNLQLSAMDWSAEALRAPTLHHIAYQGFRPGAVTHRALHNYGDRVPELPAHDTPAALVSVHRNSLELGSRWDYTDTSDHITSPSFAPRRPNTDGVDGDRSRYAGTDPGGHDGYVVQPVMSDNGFRVELFDAARVGDGPVATLRAPGGRCVPLLLHSAWMNRAVGAETGPQRERLRFSDELDDGRLAALGAHNAAVARSVAADLDDAG